MRLKLDTITGTGRAMTKTPLKEQIEPNILPAIVFGTMSPYLGFKQTKNNKNLFKNYVSHVRALLKTVTALFLFANTFPYFIALCLCQLSESQVSC